MRLSGQARTAVLATTTLALFALATVVAVGLPRWSAPVQSAPAQAPTTTPAWMGVIREVERQATLEDGRVELQAILATPAYLRVTGQLGVAQRYAVERDIVFIFTEGVHVGRLPAAVRPPLIVDGREYLPARTDVLVDSPHHRVSALVYVDPAGALAVPATRSAELRIPGAMGDLRWERPFGGSAAADGPALSIPLFLALLGGMLASMWPCLLQLTAYFLPSVAGLSLQEASSGGVRSSVVRTAVLFVSGIVIVYTLAGLVVGIAAQSLGGAAVLESVRRPLTVAAGLVILGMAGWIALRARRPLACKMPLASASRRSGLATVALGLAFATGCMTCFGAVVLVGMFTYVVSTASPLVGAAVLFTFSLGIAVPLVIAAAAMARVVPLLTRLERAAPVLSLASAGVMGTYGVVLLADSGHVLSDLFARLASAAR